MHSVSQRRRTPRAIRFYCLACPFTSTPPARSVLAARQSAVPASVDTVQMFDSIGAVTSFNVSGNSISVNPGPTSTISFPANHAWYNATTWTGTIAGTADDVGGPGLSQVDLSIQRGSDGKYWDGGGFNSATVVPLVADGTTNWTSSHLAAGNLSSTTSYTVNAWATDTASIVQTPPTAATFTYQPILVFSTQPPSSTVAGSPFSAVVAVEDANGNVVTGDNSDQVTLTLGNANGATLGGVNPVTVSGGLATFTLHVDQAGTGYNLAATSGPLTSATSASFSVTAATATHYSVSAPAASRRECRLNVTVTALDQFNNTATGYLGTAHFTSSDGAAVLPPDSPLTNGKRTVSATLNTLPQQTLTAVDTVNGLIIGTSNPITVDSAVTLAPPTLPGDTINVAYNQTITAGGGTGAIGLVVSNIQNAVPGLVVPASGSGTLAISGTPTATGTETFTVTATDSVGATTTTNYSITVNSAVTLSPPSLPARHDQHRLQPDNHGQRRHGDRQPGGEQHPERRRWAGCAGQRDWHAGDQRHAHGHGHGDVHRDGHRLGRGHEDRQLLDYGQRGRHAQPVELAGGHDQHRVQPNNHGERGHGNDWPGGEQHPERRRRAGRAGQRDRHAGDQRHAHGHRHGDVHRDGHRLGWGPKITNYSITVNAAVTLSPPSLPADTINVAYNQTITAGGGTGTVNLAVSNIQNAVAGLVVPASGTGTLAITGTPTATGTETFTVTATDSLGGTTSTNYSITVNSAVTLSPSSLPADTINIAYNQTITASGGTGTIGLAVSNIQNAVAGLVVPASGTGSLTISGTPTAAGIGDLHGNGHRLLGRYEDHQLLDHGQPGCHAQPAELAGRHAEHRLQPNNHGRRRHGNR